MIQRANVRALSGGVTTDKVFDMVVKIKKNSSVPMGFMTMQTWYFSYGTERFIKTAAEIGMDGLILPDVPFEEKEEFDSVCKKYGIDLISLIAPDFSMKRVAQIVRDAEGFVYCVSSLGVTGTRTNITTDIGAMVKLVKAVKDIPCAVGFGISMPEQAKKMAAQSGRGNCRICNCEVVCRTWRGLCTVCERVCEVYERCCNGSLGVEEGCAETYFISCAVSKPKNFSSC